MLSGGMSAEYRLPSVVNAALESGSNAFNGSLYEYSAESSEVPSSGTRSSSLQTTKVTALVKALHKTRRCRRRRKSMEILPERVLFSTRSQQS